MEDTVCVVCSTFEPQAWRKSLCKNCFHGLEEHSGDLGTSTKGDDQERKPSTEKKVSTEKTPSTEKMRSTDSPKDSGTAKTNKSSSFTPMKKSSSADNIKSSTAPQTVNDKKDLAEKDKSKDKTPLKGPSSKFDTSFSKRVPLDFPRASIGESEKKQSTFDLKSKTSVTNDTHSGDASKTDSSAKGRPSLNSSRQINSEPPGTSKAVGLYGSKGATTEKKNTFQASPSTRGSLRTQQQSSELGQVTSKMPPNTTQSKTQVKSATPGKDVPSEQSVTGAKESETAGSKAASNRRNDPSPGLKALTDTSKTNRTDKFLKSSKSFDDAAAREKETKAKEQELNRLKSVDTKISAKQKEPEKPNVTQPWQKDKQQTLTSKDVTANSLPSKEADREKLKAKEEEIQKLEKELKLLKQNEKELEKLRAQEKTHKESSLKLEEKLNGLNKKLSEIEKKCKCLEDENSAMKRTSQKKVDDAQSVIDDLKGKLSKMESKCTNLESENAKLVKTRKTVKEENDVRSTKSFSADLEQENAQLKRDVQELRSEMDEMYDTFRENEMEEFRDLQKELEITSKNCRILQIKLRKAERQTEQIESEKTFVEERLHILQGQNESDDTRSHIQRVEDELTSVKNSTVRLHDELDLVSEKKNKAEEDNRHLTELLEQADKKQFRMEMEIDKLRDQIMDLKQELKYAKNESSRKGVEGHWKEDSDSVMSKVTRDLYDSIERENDLKDQLKFTEEEAKMMRQKLAELEEENEGLNLQIRKMSQSNQRRDLRSRTRNYTDINGDGDNSGGIDMKIQYELLEEELSLSRKKFSESQQNNESLRREISLLQEQLEQKTQLLNVQPEPTSPNAYYEDKIRQMNLEADDFRWKLIEKEREIERLCAQMSFIQHSTRHYQAKLKKSKSLDSDSQLSDFKKQVEQLTIEVSVSNEKLAQARAEKEKIVRQSSKQSLEKSTQTEESVTSALDSSYQMLAAERSDEVRLSTIREEVLQADHTKIVLSGIEAETSSDILSPQQQSHRDGVQTEGKYVILTKEAEELRYKLEELNDIWRSKSAASEDEKQKLEDEIRFKNDHIQMLSLMVEKLKDDLGEKEKLINESSNALQQTEKAIIRQVDVIEEQDELLKRKDKDSKIANQELSQVKNTIRELREWVQNRDERLKEKDEMLHKLNDDVEMKEGTIKDLTNRLKDRDKAMIGHPGLKESSDYASQTDVEKENCRLKIIANKYNEQITVLEREKEETEAKKKLLENSAIDWMKEKTQLQSDLQKCKDKIKFYESLVPVTKKVVEKPSDVTKTELKPLSVEVNQDRFAQGMDSKHHRTTGQSHGVVEHMSPATWESQSMSKPVGRLSPAVTPTGEGSAAAWSKDSRSGMNFARKSDSDSESKSKFLDIRHDKRLDTVAETREDMIKASRETSKAADLKQTVQPTISPDGNIQPTVPSQKTELRFSAQRPKMLLKSVSFDAVPVSYSLTPSPSDDRHASTPTETTAGYRRQVNIGHSSRRQMSPRSARRKFFEARTVSESEADFVSWQGKEGLHSASDSRQQRNLPDPSEIRKVAEEDYNSLSRKRGTAPKIKSSVSWDEQMHSHVSLQQQSQVPVSQSDHRPKADVPPDQISSSHAQSLQGKPAGSGAQVKGAERPTALFTAVKRRLKHPFMKLQKGKRPESSSVDVPSHTSHNEQSDVRQEGPVGHQDMQHVQTGDGVTGAEGESTPSQTDDQNLEKRDTLSPLPDVTNLSNQIWKFDETPV